MKNGINNIIKLNWEEVGQKKTARRLVNSFIRFHFILGFSIVIAILVYRMEHGRWPHFVNDVFIIRYNIRKLIVHENTTKLFFNRNGEFIIIDVHRLVCYFQLWNLLVSSRLKKINMISSPNRPTIFIAIICIVLCALYESSDSGVIRISDLPSLGRQSISNARSVSQYIWEAYHASFRTLRPDCICSH